MWLFRSNYIVFLLSVVQELAVYHGKQKLESARKANEGITVKKRRIYSVKQLTLFYRLIPGLHFCM